MKVEYGFYKNEIVALVPHKLIDEKKCRLAGGYEDIHVVGLSSNFRTIHLEDGTSIEFESWHGFLERDWIQRDEVLPISPALKVLLGVNNEM